MDLSLLMRSLDTLRREYAGRRSEEAKSKGVLPPPLDIRELTIEVGLHVVRGADGEERLELVEGASNPGVSGSPTSCHRLTLKLGSPASSGAVAVTGSAKRAMVPDAVIIADAEGESAAGGDEATLLRRLEIVLADRLDLPRGRRRRSLPTCFENSDVLRWWRTCIGCGSVSLTQVRTPVLR